MRKTAEAPGNTPPRRFAAFPRRPGRAASARDPFLPFLIVNSGNGAIVNSGNGAIVNFGSGAIVNFGSGAPLPPGCI